MTAVVRSLLGECGDISSRGCCDRPTTFSYEFGTHAYVAIDRWRDWGEATAVGTGRFHYSDEEGRFEAPVRLSLSATRRCSDLRGRAYTRLQLEPSNATDSEALAPWSEPITGSC